MATILNNNTHNFFETHKSGSGIGVIRVPFGYMMISGKSGEVVRVPATDLYLKAGEDHDLLKVQALMGSVQVDVTLAPPDLAMNPIHDDGGHWVVDTTAAPGTIMVLKNYFTAIRFTFLGDAILYVLGS